MRNSFKLSLTVGLLCAPLSFALPPSAQAQLKIEPGQELNYHIEKTHSGTVKVLGTTASADEIWITDVSVKAKEADANGRIPLELTVKNLSGTTPVLEGLTVKTVKYDYAKRDKNKRLPHHSLLQYEAMMKRPLTLLYLPTGKLDGIGGTDELYTDINTALNNGFQNESDFASAGPLYRMLYSEKNQKLIWEQLLVFDLPEDFEVGLEWKQQQLIYIQPFSAWTNAKYIADDADDGGYSIEATFDFPANKQASITFGPQKYVYSVKNGTGTGKFEIDVDGRVRRLETVMHVYFNNSLIAGDQTIPFDQYYSKLEYKIERQE